MHILHIDTIAECWRAVCIMWRSRVRSVSGDCGCEPCYPQN